MYQTFRKTLTTQPNPRVLLLRYRVNLINSGANGRLTCSAYIVLAIFIAMMVLIPIFPQRKEKIDNVNSTLPIFLFSNFAFFWLSCGSFLADTEPRQFILRRLSRAWTNWSAGRVEARWGRGRRKNQRRKRRGRFTNAKEKDTDEIIRISANQNNITRLVVENVGGRKQRRISRTNLQTQVQVEVEVHSEERGGESGVLGAKRSVRVQRGGEVKDKKQEYSDIELEEVFVVKQQAQREKFQTTVLGEYPAQQGFMTDIDI